MCKTKRNIFLLTFVTTAVFFIICALIGYDLHQEEKLHVPQEPVWVSGGATVETLCGPKILCDLSLPLTALASFPGSGNTWVRYLIQEATGILTGSEYNDSELLLNGFPAEGVSNSSTLVVKTHNSDTETFTKYHRAILLLRHPKDAILAEFNRVYSSSHFARASYEHFVLYWPHFLHEHMKAWQDFYQRWSTFPRELFILQYSHLTTDVSVHLRATLNFLKINITEVRLDCAVKNSGDRFRRRRLANQFQRRHFTTDDEKTLDNMYDESIRNLRKTAGEWSSDERAVIL